MVRFPHYYSFLAYTLWVCPIPLNCTTGCPFKYVYIVGWDNTLEFVYIVGMYQSYQHFFAGLQVSYAALFVMWTRSSFTTCFRIGMVVLVESELSPRLADLLLCVILSYLQIWFLLLTIGKGCFMLFNRTQLEFNKVSQLPPIICIKIKIVI